MNLSKLGGFVRRHRRAEEELAVGAGISIGWRIVGGLLGAGVAAAAIAIPTMIDLSNNNGARAAAAIASPGVHLVEAKATEGLGFRDGLYPTFRATAAKYHKAFGGYLFLHPNESGRAQADYFLAYAAPKPGDVEPVVDSEMGGACASAPATLAALRELSAKGFAPILYSNTSWLEQFARCAPALEKYPVWEAEYGPVLTHVVAFRVVAWQYTDNSGVRGMRIDGSRLYVPVASLTIPTSRPKSTDPAAREARLTHVRGGYFVWYDWREAREAWKGLAPHEHDARPLVRHRIPDAWWVRLEVQASGG